MKQILHNGMMFIDIGANIGEISMVAAEYVGNAGRVVAFEPIDAIADELQINIEQNHMQQISLARMGLSDSIDDNGPIYASCRRGRVGDEHKGLGSLFGAKTGATQLQNIAVTTLDAWLAYYPLDRIDMIKVDIEGAELPCLKGAQTLAKFKPMLVVDVQESTVNIAGYHAKDILEFLTEFSYTLRRFWRGRSTRFINAGNVNMHKNILCMTIDKVEECHNERNSNSH